MLLHRMAGPTRPARRQRSQSRARTLLATAAIARALAGPRSKSEPVRNQRWASCGVTLHSRYSRFSPRPLMHLRCTNSPSTIRLTGAVQSMERSPYRLLPTGLMRRAVLWSQATPQVSAWVNTWATQQTTRSSFSEEISQALQSSWLCIPEFISGRCLL